VRDGLAAGRPVREFPAPDAAPDAARQLAALTSAPVLYVANVDEGETEVPAAVAERAAASGSKAIAISARIESELTELDEPEAEEMRAGMGIEASGLERLVRAAYELLDLITFFTADRDVEGWDQLVEAGGWAGVRDAAVLRIEGRDYVVQDGDVVHIKT
jgi:ribosome-binding ATPase YchF (GTP1/OBG family)